MPRQLLPASAAAFAPRASSVNVVLGSEVEPWLTQTLKRIKIKRPLNSVPQHQQCLTQILSSNNALWTLASLLLPKTPEADLRKDPNPLVEAHFNYQMLHLEAYVVHVDMVLRNEVAYKLTPETIESLIEYHKDIYCVDSMANTHDRHNWPEKEQQCKKLHEGFVQAVNKFVFRAHVSALEGLEEDGVGELLGGSSEEVKNNVMGLIKPLLPPPPPALPRPARYLAAKPAAHHAADMLALTHDNENDNEPEGEITHGSPRETVFEAIDGSVCGHPVSQLTRELQEHLTAKGAQAYRYFAPIHYEATLQQCPAGAAMSQQTYDYAPRPAPARTRHYSNHHSTSSTSSSPANPDEDWTKTPHPAECRRIRNRIANGNYRKKLKKRLEELERRDNASSSGNEKQSPPTKAKRTLTPKAQRQASPAQVKLALQSLYTAPLQHDDKYLFPSSYSDRERLNTPPIFAYQSSYGAVQGYRTTAAEPDPDCFSDTIKREPTYAGTSGDALPLYMSYGGYPVPGVEITTYPSPYDQMPHVSASSSSPSSPPPSPPFPHDPAPNHERHDGVVWLGTRIAEHENGRWLHLDREAKRFVLNPEYEVDLGLEQLPPTPGESVAGAVA